MGGGEEGRGGGVVVAAAAVAVSILVFVFESFDVCVCVVFLLGGRPCLCTCCRNSTYLISWSGVCAMVVGGGLSGSPPPLFLVPHPPKRSGRPLTIHSPNLAVFRGREQHDGWYYTPKSILEEGPGMMFLVNKGYPAPKAPPTPTRAMWLPWRAPTLPPTPTRKVKSWMKARGWHKKRLSSSASLRGWPWA